MSAKRSSVIDSVSLDDSLYSSVGYGVFFKMMEVMQPPTPEIYIERDDNEGDSRHRMEVDEDEYEEVGRALIR